jgi:hypothetical protein
MGHRIPFEPELPIDAHMFATSAKYLCKLFAKFDKDVLGKVEASDAYASYDLVYDKFSAFFNDDEGNSAVDPGTNSNNG